MSEHVNDKPPVGAARHVQPSVSDARLARVWARVEQRLPGQRKLPRPGWLWLGVSGFGLAAAAVLAWLVVLPHFEAPAETDSLLAGAVLETASDSLSVALSGGSSLELDKGSRVEVVRSRPGAVHLRLTRGRIHCDVKPRQSSRFVVTAEGVQVRVVGTRFSVATERHEQSHRVEVQVERGVVEVRSPGQESEVVRLSAGRSWSRVIQTGPAKARIPQNKAASSAQPEPPEAEPEPSKAKPSVAQRPSSSARELLEEANSLRRAGKPRQAAKHYEMLLANHSSDARAGLAAFELGRLRMDRFGDLSGAVAAFEKAMQLTPGSGFREDALARLVTAHARSGNAVACRQAKERYLQSYPRGVHRQAVRDQCSER